MSERRWCPSGGRCAGSLRKFFSFVASFQSHSPKEIDQLSPPPTSLLPPKRALRVHGLRFLIRLEAFLLHKKGVRVNQAMRCSQPRIASSLLADARSICKGWNSKRYVCLNGDTLQRYTATTGFVGISTDAALPLSKAASVLSRVCSCTP